MTGDDVVRKIAARIAELRKTLAGIEAEIARSAAAHREQAEQLGRSIDAINAEIAQRARQVVGSRTETSRRERKGPPADDPSARSSSGAP